MNRIYLDRIEMKTKNGEKENGFRLFDDYDTTTHTPLEGVPDDDLELLEMVVLNFCKEDGSVDAIVDHLISNEKGICINDTWYDYSDIKKILNIRAKELNKVLKDQVKKPKKKGSK